MENLDLIKQNLFVNKSGIDFLERVQAQLRGYSSDSCQCESAGLKGGTSQGIRLQYAGRIYPDLIKL